MKITEKVSQFCIDIAERDNQLDDVKKEHFIFAIDYIFRNVVFLTAFVLVLVVASSIEKNITILTIVTFISFNIVRINFGGYHFISSKVCFILSIIFPIVCGILAHYFIIPFLVSIFFYGLLIICIYQYGVVDHPNKKLPDKMKKRLTKRGYIMVPALIIIHCLLAYNNYQEISTTITLAVFVSIISLFLGKRYNYSSSLESNAKEL